LEDEEIYVLPDHRPRPVGPFHPLPPSDAVRKQKNSSERIFSVQYCHDLKKYHPSGNLKLINLVIFQSLKLRILVEKMLAISHNLNFTPNTLGCNGLNKAFALKVMFAL